MIWLCGDPGSTHDGSLEKAREMVKIGAGAGLNAIKFQLLGESETKAGNVLLPWAWLPELIDLGKSLGVEVFASVFNKAGAEWLAQIGCKSIKYAFSQAGKFDNHDLSAFDTAHVSRDLLSPPVMIEWGKEPKKWVTLWAIPLYPVPYVVDFEGRFPPYDGFSSHCLGIKQEIAAVQAGAKYLEFHYQGPWSSPTPDARFAKSPELTAKLVKEIRRIEMHQELSAVAAKYWEPIRKRRELAEETFKDIPHKSAPAVPFMPAPDGMKVDLSEEQGKPLREWDL